MRSTTSFQRAALKSHVHRRHSYVRRNAVLAINGLFKLPKGELLLPDAPELIEKACILVHKP